MFSSGCRAFTEEHVGGHGVGHGEGDGVGTQCSTWCRNIYSTWQRTGYKTCIGRIEGKNSLLSETWAWHIVGAQQTCGPWACSSSFYRPILYMGESSASVILNALILSILKEYLLCSQNL